MHEVANLPTRTLEKLDKEATPARPDMTCTKEVLYSNEESGTVVYRVLTNNDELVQRLGYGQNITWGHLLIGNENGYVESEVYVASEANIRIGEIYEDAEKIVLERQGTKTIYFGLTVDVEDLVVKKSDFKPYNK